MKKGSPQKPRLGAHLVDSLQSSTEKYLRNATPARDEQAGYVYGEGLSEDHVILQDILGSHHQVSRPHEHSSSSYYEEYQTRLAGSSKRLVPLAQPKLESVLIDQYIEANKDEVFTIIPYELLPVEEEENTQSDTYACIQTHTHTYAHAHRGSRKHVTKEPGLR